MGDAIGNVTGADAEIYVLGGTVATRVGAVETDHTKQADRWLIMALALSGAEGIEAAAAQRDLGISNDALRASISRIRRRSGLDWRIESVRGRGYRLDTSDVVVDVLKFLRLVEAHAPDAGARRASLRQARSMLTGGLPIFTEFALPHAETYARFRLAEREVRSGGQRILVVDDQIGHNLADRLRLSDHACEVATSIEEYRQFENRLGDFDLVIVDRHLEQGGYDDRLGDDIVENISRRPDGVPVMMMTFDVPDHLDLTSLQEKYGLAGAQRKRFDGENADLGLLADRVEEILLDGPVNRACEALEQGMAVKRRRAQKRLREQHTEPRLTRELNRMKEEAAEVIAIAASNDLQKARIAQRSFVAQWLGGSY